MAGGFGDVRANGCVASLLYGPVLLAAEAPAARPEWRQVVLPGSRASLEIAMGDWHRAEAYDTGAIIRGPAR